MKKLLILALLLQSTYPVSTKLFTIDAMSYINSAVAATAQKQAMQTGMQCLGALTIGTGLGFSLVTKSEYSKLRIRKVSLSIQKMDNVNNAKAITDLANNNIEYPQLPPTPISIANYDTSNHERQIWNSKLKMGIYGSLGGFCFLGGTYLIWKNR